MVAKFYLAPQSFAFNNLLSSEEIESRIKLLAQDVIEIKKYKETNHFFVHPEVYQVRFVQTVTLMDLLFDSSVGRKCFDRDALNALQRIVVEAQETSISTEEVVEKLLPKHDEYLCHGLLAFHRVQGIPESFQVIYGISGWFTFRRYFLGLYPRTPDFFIDECKKYFPNLFFHERNKVTIRSIFSDCPKRIVNHLSSLNDKFRNSQQAGLNRSQVLQHFSVSAALDEEASLEGNSAKKSEMTFEFLNDAGKIENVCCEPHLKLCRNDGFPGDTSYSNDRRIYFHEGRINIHRGKILIGHIGRHL